MIKMKAGTFGGRVNGKLTAITPAHGPFSTDEATEERLVKAGVAEYVEGPAGEKAGGKQEPPAWHEALTYPELQKIAKEKGLGPNGKKADLIARIEAAEKAAAEKAAAGAGAPEAPAGTEGAGEKDDETPPSFDPAKTVV